MKPPYDYPVTPAILERLACDGRCRTILEHNGEITAWTDAAHPPPALEQAVLRRDGHCVIKGCRAQHGQIHHIIWRSRKGPTVIWNLVLVCWRHHRMIHDQGWQLTGHAGTLQWARPDGTILWTTGPPQLAA